MKEYKIVLGSTFGDEGKGATVQWLCQKALNEHRKPCVIRFSGGPQAGHTIRHNGIEHICSSFGSGVLLGIPTLYISCAMWDPISLLKEKQVLESNNCTPEVINLQGKFVITPYDVIANQTCEKTLRDGTCGKGIWEAYKRMSCGVYSNNPHTIIHRCAMYHKIKNRELTLEQNFIDSYNECMDTFKVIPWTNIADLDFDVFIFEGTQGLLLDSVFGFLPHVTATSVGLVNILQSAFFNPLSPISHPKVDLYLVTRTYTTRHGNGYDPKYPITIPNWKNESNVCNEFQGRFKTGLLEVPLIQRAIDRQNLANDCKRNNISPHLVVTHVDLIESGNINMCYTNSGLQKFSSMDDALELLIDELDSYLPIEHVYYSDNPDSNFKVFI